MFNLITYNLKLVSATILLLVIIGLRAISVSAYDIDLPIQNPSQPACGSGNIVISEINYVVRNPEKEAEIILLKGVSGTSLSGLEVHVLDAESNLVMDEPIDLVGYSTSSIGEFIIGNNTVDTEHIDLEHAYIIDSIDFIPDDGPGSIGIFDTSSDQYCKVVNYGGSPDEMSDWTHIGTDHSSNVSSQGCKYDIQSSLWGCNERVQFAEPNQTVSVGLSQSSAAFSTSPWTILLVAGGLPMTFVLTRRHKA